MKIKDIFSKKIREILKNKIKLIIIFTIFFVLITLIFYSFKLTYAVPENSDSNLFFPNISEHSEPTELLVMVFLYNDYTEHNESVDRVFSMTDEEIQSKYYNEIFGSGNIEEQTWSVNDYYKENSSGKFYFKPVLIGDDESGVHLVKFNKTYNMDNFSSDITEGFKTLIDKGINLDGYGMNWDDSAKKKILCIFPKILVEHLGGYRINENKVADMAITSYSTIPSTTIHELGHSLGLPDLYNQGSQATLMGTVEPRSDIADIRYPGTPYNYNIQPHMDPLHKIALGWQNYEIIDTNTTVKLYPTTSALYNPIIVPTGDNNQYYIIENRIATSFESQITKYYSRGDIEDPEDAGFSSYEGINIWRVDKLGYNSMGSSEYSYDSRKGDFVIGNLKYENETFFPKKYLSADNDLSNLKEYTNIKITYLKNNLDGSVDVGINFDDKYKNSYIVRYNANNETNDYIDKTYFYTQKVEFLFDAFYKEDYKIVEWNTMPDGSGIGYKYYNEVYGLTDEQDGVVNLYAQWKKQKSVISFNSNGGIGTMEDIELTQDIINDGYILPEPKFISPNPNLIFKGWYVPEYDSVKQPSEKVYLTTDNILVAQWGENNNCIINFNTNGGSTIDSQHIIKGYSAIEPEPPIKDGYIFGGWYVDDMYTTMFYFGQFIYSDLTLYAKWIPNENVLKAMDLKIELPTVGENVTIEKYEGMDFWDWNSQKPQMKILISDDEHYHLADDGGMNYMNWITKDYFDNILDPYSEEPFIGKFEYDKTYYARIFLEADKDYLFDKDIKITANGSNNVKLVYSFENFLDIAVEITIPKEKEELTKYNILDGANQNYILESEQDLTIKVDGEISNFEGVKVDDIVVAKENYTLTSGSTIITLKQSYLNTLVQGAHKITFIYKDGEVSTTFTIDNPKIDNKNDETIEEVVTTTKPIENIKDKNNNLPTTGDGVIIWGLLFIIGLIGSIITYKKIRSKYETN